MSVSLAERTSRAAERVRSKVSPTAVVTGTLAVILMTNRIGVWLHDHGHRLYLGMPPLTGRWDPLPLLRAAPSVAVGVGLVWAWPRLASRATWRHLLWIACGAAALWAVALASAEGIQGLTKVSATDYLPVVRDIGSPGTFLASFVDRIGTFTVHVRAHPPGYVLLLWALDRIGLAGAGWLAVLQFGAAASSVPATLIALRETAGEAIARRAAPFLVLAPAVVSWTSGDAFFLGVGAWAVALLILATGREGRHRDRLALAGGLLFGAGLFLSYGLILLGVIPIVVVVARRSWRVAAFAALGVLAVVAGFALAGFWWPAGLSATRVEYANSVARFRPYPYFLLANVAALALVVGPAAWAGLSQLRRSGVWLLAGGALAAVALADLSGLSKGEVERIWLPFIPWIIVATAALPKSSTRRWLLAQVAFAVAIQMAVPSPW